MNRHQDSNARPAARRLPNLVVQASAGTGKTHRLAIRYLRLIVDGCPADRILATTFTRKAAGEIFDRVIKRLTDAVGDATQRTQLRQDLALDTLTRGDCLLHLGSLTRQLHRQRIGTLDSFFSQMARNFSLELGLPTRWDICDESVDSTLRRRSIQQLLSQTNENVASQLVHLLSRGDADRRVGGNMLDAVDMCYDVYRASHESAWQHIQRRTCLNDEELADAVQRLREAPLPNDKRFHAAHAKSCDQALHEDWEEFLTKGLVPKIASGEGIYYKKPIDPPLMDCYRPLIEQANASILNRVANNTEGTYRIANRFDLFYQRHKSQTGQYQFDDVTARLAEMFESPENDRVAFRMDGAIDHLLLDEFQDTSLMQWRVLRPFAERVTDTQTTYTSFFCVGDTKQAIYAWRGGRCEILDGLTKSFEDLVAETMSESYRSAPPIIDVVNRVFGNIPDKHARFQENAAFQRWTRQFPKHTTARKSLQGYVEICAADFDSDRQPDKLQTLRRTAAKVAELVERYPGMSIGVLMGSHEQASELIYQLELSDVAASAEGGRELTNSASVRLVLSLLKLADHPGHSVAQFHLCTSPLAESLGMTADVVDPHRAWIVSRKVRQELIETGYGPTIQRYATRLEPFCSAWECRRLRQLIDLAHGYDHRSTLRCDDFVAFIERQKVADPTLADVAVMTIHASKGLQFDIVVLPELDNRQVFTGGKTSIATGYNAASLKYDPVCRYQAKKYWKYLPKSIQELFEEETQRQIYEGICRFYVAMTRAVHSLHLVVAPSPANEKGLPQSYAGILRATLLDGARLEALEDYPIAGSPDWYHRPERDNAEVTTKPCSRSRQKKPLPRWNRGAPRDLEAVSPSKMEGGARVRLAERFRLDAQAALRYGSLIHGWMELIEWLDAGQPTDDQLARVAEGLETSGIDVERSRDQFREMLACSAVQGLLGQSLYRAQPPVGWATDLRSGLESDKCGLEIRNEQPMVAVDDGHLISGYIDRLVIARDGDRIRAADIIDFKTDQVAAADRELLSEKTAFYRPQLLAYRRSISSMLRLSNQAISSRLLFVSCGVVVEVQGESG